MLYSENRLFYLTAESLKDTEEKIKLSALRLCGDIFILRCATKWHEGLHENIIVS